MLAACTPRCTPRVIRVDLARGTLLPYSESNIEDWDFRSFRDPALEGGLAASDPMVLFLGDNFIEVLATDRFRLALLNNMIERDMAYVLEGSGDLALTPFGEEALPHLPRPRDFLTRGGRGRRRICKSLIREWSKYGRLRHTVLPHDLSESFAGLFDSEDPDDAYAAYARERAAALHDPASSRPDLA